eukprot:TRINITY_DN2676_c0_g1_i1.p1 TRINITY_DN2676_c0_g1~~TRINITY_DN2676_c0_g1_i1.p1  ORF type:complete len:366 (-),score=105.57 TRINITY_DN2676_c0_g1_i1:591-1688(-)
MGWKKDKKEDESTEMDEKHHELNKEHFKDTRPGPMEDRSCTDIIFLILFIAYWVGMFIVAGIAVNKGEPERLFYGVDSDGNICGHNNLFKNESLRGRAQDLREKSFLYFIPNISLSSSISFYEVCIEECPKETILFPDSTSEIVCPYRVDYSLDNVFPNGTCFPTFNTRPIVRRCIPYVNANYTAIAGKVTQTLNLQRAADLSNKLISDLVAAWRYIAGAAAVALVLSFMWLALMRKLAGVIVWSTILAAIGSLTVLCIFLYNQAVVNQTAYNKLPASAKFAGEEDTIHFLKGVFIFLAIVDGLCILITIFMIKRIRIAVGLFKETAKAMMKMPFILLVPVFVALAFVPLAVYWIYIGAYLATAG